MVSDGLWNFKFGDQKLARFWPGLCFCKRNTYYYFAKSHDGQPISEITKKYQSQELFS